MVSVAQNPTYDMPGKDEKPREINATKFGLRYAVGARQGRRPHMEDYHFEQVGLSNDPPLNEWSFFSIHDGHGGSDAARFTARHMLDELLPGLDQIALHVDRMGSEKEIESVYKSACLKMDKRLRQDNATDNSSGCTTICATTTPNSIIIANLGDSRALLSYRNGKYIATKDHKPTSPTERKRIKEAGSAVINGRVAANLALSRALGDFEFKDVPGLPPTKQPVSAEPDVYILERNPGNDEFLILASDGIFDVFENDELQQYIRKLLKSSRNLEDVVNEVLEETFLRGSLDNMTFILIVFN
uniref:PPM-type phosphatase domain-containing protein n=1 Tax=Acrobeloides nanus TaxID=290746 RepID=A0A914CV43_9BILA